MSKTPITQPAIERDPNTEDWVDEAPPRMVNPELLTAIDELERKHALAPHPDHPAFAEFTGKDADALPSVSAALNTVQHGTALAIPTPESSGEVATMMRKSRLIVELQALDELEARTQYEKGKRFAELKTLCERGEFLRVLSTQLQGISERSAYNCMQFYQLCEQAPSLRGALEGNFTKALTLRNALHEEGLDGTALAAPEFKDITPEVIDTMNAAQLKKEIKRLTREVGAVVKEETKALVQERDQLIKERDEAIAKFEAPNWKATKERAAELAKLAEKLGAQVAILLDGMPEGEIPHDTVFGLEASLFRAQTATQSAWNRFSARTAPEEVQI